MELIFRCIEDLKKRKRYLLNVYFPKISFAFGKLKQFGKNTPEDHRKFAIDFILYTFEDKKWDRYT